MSELAATHHSLLSTHHSEGHPAVSRALAREGRITFARYMQLALYHHRWGYYSKIDTLGESGDFYTSPELHPLFAAAVAARAHAVWLATGSPEPFDFVESGGGSGRFARDFLRYADDRFPDLAAVLRYRIDDRGANLRKAQLQRLIEAGLDRRVRWSDGSPTAWAQDSIRGTVFANELLDALSVHLVTARDGELHELYVRGDGERLVLEPGPLSTPALGRYFDVLGINVPDGVQWEVNLNAVRWIRRAARALAEGALLLIDYGYEAPDLYSGHRPAGTLLCYQDHTVHSDPLQSPGERDITTYVDLTTARATLQVAGITIVEAASQSQALGAAALSQWRDWTLRASGGWSRRAGLARSLDALSDAEGLGRLQWLLGLKRLPAGVDLPLADVPPPWSHALLDDHLVLPDPAALDPITDVEEQWRELWEGDDPAID